MMRIFGLISSYEQFIDGMDTALTHSLSPFRLLPVGQLPGSELGSSTTGHLPHWISGLPVSPVLPSALAPSEPGSYCVRSRLPPKTKTHGGGHPSLGSNPGISHPTGNSPSGSPPMGSPPGARARPSIPWHGPARDLISRCPDFTHNDRLRRTSILVWDRRSS